MPPFNLSFYAQTIGQVEFDLFDEFGQTVLKQELANGQTLAQFNVENLGEEVYYWRLTDSQRTIKADKIAIMK